VSAIECKWAGEVSVCDRNSEKVSHYPRVAVLVLVTASKRAAPQLELDPDSAEAHASRGHVLGLGKRFDEAKVEFETAIRLAPTLFESHYLFARACWAEGRMEEAARHFEEASRVRPEDYQSPALVSTVYEKLGQPAKAEEARLRAIAAARRQIELYPTDVRALYLGAGALRREGHEAEAQEWARRVLASVYYNLVLLHVRE
jgi:adenylate cyclase